MWSCSFGNAHLLARIWFANSAAAQCPVATHGPEALHTAEHKRSSWAPLRPPRPFRCCMSPLRNPHACVRVRALKSVPFIFYQSEMRTHRRRAGEVPYWNSLLWVLGPKMAREASRDKLLRQLWACGAAQLQRLTFNGAPSDFYFWTKGKV